MRSSDHIWSLDLRPQAPACLNFTLQSVNPVQAEANSLPKPPPKKAVSDARNPNPPAPRPSIRTSPAPAPHSNLRNLAGKYSRRRARIRCHNRRRRLTEKRSRKTAQDRVVSSRPSLKWSPIQLQVISVANTRRRSSNDSAGMVRRIRHP